MKFYGNLLRLVRSAKNLSQDDLARKVGISKSAISRYETGSRILSRNRFNDICQRLKLPKSLIDLLISEKILPQNKQLAEKIGIILIQEIEGLNEKPKRY